MPRNWTKRPDPQRNRAGFYSSRCLGSDKKAHILATWLGAVIHQLFAVSGVNKRLSAGCAQKHVPIRPSGVTQRPHARWKTDSRVDQPAQRTEQGERCNNTVQTCESLIHYAVTMLQNARVWTRPKANTLSLHRSSETLKGNWTFGQPTNNANTAEIAGIITGWIGWIVFTIWHQNSPGE